MTTTGAIERAFELARSGRFTEVSKLEDALSREGYAGARHHLSGAHTRKQLKAVIKEAPHNG
jgi:hypothetical protein